MGEDNASVFRDLLGLTETEYADYLATGAIEAPPEPNPKSPRPTDG
jgi:hypothetical protein